MKRLSTFSMLAYSSLLMSYTPAVLAANTTNATILYFSLGLCLGITLTVLVSLYINRQYRSKYYQVLQKYKLSKRDTQLVKKAMQKIAQEQQDNQDLLEDRVQERTIELNIALQELESANQELERKNISDELTGLHNRRFYDQKILAEYRRSRRNHTALSLVLIDIDHFKNVNDTHGHLAGDHCLVIIAKFIKESLKRSTDKAFRYGGEEFCLILPDTDAEGALLIAEQLRKAVGKEVLNFEEIEIPVTISCGICTYQQQTDIGPEQLFSGADKALYQAKESGRNQTVQYIFTE